MRWDIFNDAKVLRAESRVAKILSRGGEAGFLIKLLIRWEK